MKMKEIVEVKFETKATVSTGYLPKGLTDGLQKLFEKAIPYAERFVEALLKEEEKETK